MIHYSNPPVLLENVIDDVQDVVHLLTRNAPYTPLGGWYRPDVDLDVATSPLWFQNDFVHADLRVEGSELFLHHERVMQAAREFYDAEVVEPHSVYVNIMAAMDSAGPAHTDNPRFQGRDRSNTPMWLLRSMLWSGLFLDESITQATSIWWMNDVEGGAFHYWPKGPDRPPETHLGAMANTAIIGDNHGMFHQVGRVGPFDQGTRLVTQRAELRPAPGGSRDWAVVDRGEVKFQAPLECFRVSVLWKADIYRDEAEASRKKAAPLSMADVVKTFNHDLASRGASVRLDLSRLEDPATVAAIQAIYPEAIPVGKQKSIYDMA